MTTVGAVAGCCPLLGGIVDVDDGGSDDTTAADVVTVDEMAVAAVVVSDGMEFNLASSTASRVSKSVMRPGHFNNMNPRTSERK